MVRYAFGQDDLLRTRFAISPLMELTGAYDVVRAPQRFEVHRPFAEWAAPRFERLETAAMEVAMPLETVWHPDFVSPPPSVPHAKLEEELARVLATPGHQVRAELARAHPDRTPELPGGTGRLVAEMRAFWNALLAPWWDRILALLEAEVGWRARRLAAVGPQAAFAGLHDDARWHGGALEVTRAGPRIDVELGGRGLLLMPAAFAWPTVWPMSDPPWQPALVYPPPGVADLWGPEQAGDEALAELLGRGRARVLLSLGAAGRHAGAGPPAAGQRGRRERAPGRAPARRAGDRAPRGAAGRVRAHREGRRAVPR